MPAELVRTGHSFEDSDETASLRAEVRGLRAELADAKTEATVARRESQQTVLAVAALRKQLLPLYRALQGVFGELDTIAGADDPAAVTAHATDSRVSAVWSAWKEKLSPSCGRVIDALMIHKDLNVQQICVAARMGKNTVYDVIAQLNKAGLLSKNGNRYSLKQL